MSVGPLGKFGQASQRRPRALPGVAGREKNDAKTQVQANAAAHSDANPCQTREAAVKASVGCRSGTQPRQAMGLCKCGSKLDSRGVCRRCAVRRVSNVTDCDKEKELSPAISPRVAFAGSSEHGVSLHQLAREGFIDKAGALQYTAERQQQGKMEHMSVWEVCELVARPDFRAYVRDRAADDDWASSTGSPSRQISGKSDEKQEWQPSAAAKLWTAVRTVIAWEALAGVTPEWSATQAADETSEKNVEQIPPSMLERRRLCSQPPPPRDMRLVPIEKKEPLPWISVAGSWDPSACAGLDSAFNPQVQFNTQRRCLVKMELHAPRVAQGVAMELLLVKGGVFGARRQSWVKSEHDQATERHAGCHTLARLVSSTRGNEGTAAASDIKTIMPGLGNILRCQHELQAHEVFTVVLACAAAADRPSEDDLAGSPSNAERVSVSSARGWMSQANDRRSSEEGGRGGSEAASVDHGSISLAFELRLQTTAPFASTPALMPLLRLPRQHRSAATSVRQEDAQDGTQLQSVEDPTVGATSRPVLRPLVLHEVGLDDGIHKSVEMASFDVRRDWRKWAKGEMQQELQSFAADLPSLFPDPKPQRSAIAGKAAHRHLPAAANVFQNG